MDMFDKLNRETQDFRNKFVDRFNPSTRANYETISFAAASSETSKYNNDPSYKNRLNSQTECVGHGYYDGRGQYHVN